MVRVGDRVGAICGEKDGVLKVYGYGVYEGDYDAPVFGDEEMFPNPRIKLDDGGYVFGYQCWWGSEAAICSKIKVWEKEGLRIEKIKPPMIGHKEGSVSCGN